MKKMQLLFFMTNMLGKIFRIWPNATKYFFFLFQNVLKYFFEIFWKKPGILIPDLYFIV